MNLGAGSRPRGRALPEGTASEGTQCYDADGAIARRGRVCGQLLDRLKADSYYRFPVPRSTGREHFNADYLRKMLIGLEPNPATRTSWRP